MSKINIYIGHSNNANFIDDIYRPIRKSKLNSSYNVVLPHEDSSEPFNSKEFLKECKYMIAEVSISATGLGIEIGWADSYEVEIICIFKKGSKVANSLKIITTTFIEYENSEDLVSKLEDYFKL